MRMVLCTWGPRHGPHTPEPFPAPGPGVGEAGGRFVPGPPTRPPTPPNVRRAPAPPWRSSGAVDAGGPDVAASLDGGLDMAPNPHMFGAPRARAVDAAC